MRGASASSHERDTGEGDARDLPSVGSEETLNPGRTYLAAGRPRKYSCRADSIRRVLGRTFSTYLRGSERDADVECELTVGGGVVVRATSGVADEEGRSEICQAVSGSVQRRRTVPTYVDAVLCEDALELVPHAGDGFPIAILFGSGEEAEGDVRELSMNVRCEICGQERWAHGVRDERDFLLPVVYLGLRAKSLVREDDDRIPVEEE